jgi:hypothetical protein
MAKGLTIVAMVVAILVFLLFAMDLVLNFPFMGARKWTMDLAFVLCALALGYLGWSAFKEVS